MNSGKLPPLPLSISRGFVAPRIALVQGFEDVDRFTMWSVARLAECLDEVTRVSCFEDYCLVTEGFAAERATLCRVDGSELDLVFTTVLELDECGEPGDETITGFGFKAHGSQEWCLRQLADDVQPLFDHIRKWASEVVINDGITPLTATIADDAGQLYTVMWKPIPETGAWDSPRWPPVRPGMDGNLVGEVFVDVQKGLTMPARHVDSPTLLRAGTYCFIEES